jgi:hypothetical protein
VIEVAVRQHEQIERARTRRAKRRHDDGVAEIESRQVSWSCVVHQPVSRSVDDDCRALTDIQHRNPKGSFCRRRTTGK